MTAKHDNHSRQPDTETYSIGVRLLFCCGNEMKRIVSSQLDQTIFIWRYEFYWRFVYERKLCFVFLGNVLCVYFVRHSSIGNDYVYTTEVNGIQIKSAVNPRHQNSYEMKQSTITSSDCILISSAFQSSRFIMDWFEKRNKKTPRKCDPFERCIVVFVVVRYHLWRCEL